MSKLLGVAPSAATDAATKAYADNLVPFLSQSGAYLMPPAYRSNNNAPTTGLLLAHLVIVRRAMTFNGFQMYISSAATGGTCRNGIYSPDPTSGLPNALYSDFGTLTSTAATGLKSVSLTAFTLQPGVYWVATLLVAGSPSLRCVEGLYAPGTIASTITGGNGGVYNATPYTGTALNSMPATFLANSSTIATSASTPVVGLLIQ